jgi:hypothetical protein
LTAQGQSRSIFKRAIENSKVVVAEMTARELGRITLEEALALTVLVVQKDPGRRSCYAVRWLLRLLQEDENLTIEDAGWRRRRLRLSAGEDTLKLWRPSWPWPKGRLGSATIAG